MQPGHASELARLGRRTFVVSTLLLLFALSAIPLSAAAGNAHVAAPSGYSVRSESVAPPAPRSLVASTMSPHDAYSERPDSSPVPSGATNGTATFYTNATVPTNQSHAQLGCEAYSGGTYVDTDCYNTTVNPTLVTLQAGELGLSYQMSYNLSASACPYSWYGSANVVGFSVSATNGATWGAPLIIANTTCSFSNSIEPSFASNGSTVYGVFVEVNDSYYYGGTNQFPTRSESALGFVKSTDNGASFSTPVTLNSGANVASPRIAVFGKTVYVVFQNVSNSSSTVAAGGPYPFGSYTPTAIDFMVSKDGGRTWTGPTTLPEENSTGLYNSVGAAIAVNRSGTVAVSYFTNESCVWVEYLSCEDYGFDLVVSTSTTNGTSWVGPMTVASSIGASWEFLENWEQDSSPESAWAPHSSITFDGVGATIYVAWDGNYNGGSVSNPQWYDTGVFFASGPTAGGTWSAQPIQYYPTPYNYDDIAIPSVAYSAGVVYITYQWANTSNCAASWCPPYVGAQVEQFGWSSDGGATWTITPLEVDYSSYCNPWVYCAYEYEGEQTSVGFTSAGTPVGAYPVPFEETYSHRTWGGIDYYNYTYPTQIHVGFPYVGPTVNVTFVENGLTSANWEFEVNGQSIPVVGSDRYTVTNVPYGAPVFIAPHPLTAGYGELIVGASSTPGISTFYSDSQVTFNYSISWALNAIVLPYVATNAYFDLQYGGTYYDLDRWLDCGTGGCTAYYDQNPYATPWYFPNGTILDLGGAGSYGITYWNGTGDGSYTGVGTTALVTMLGPINETAWAGGYGLYNETFEAQGLPTGSVYHFSFAGANYSATAGSAAIASGVLTGGYPVTDIWATSSTAGWEYFGTSSVGPTVVVPAEPIVNFSYSLEEVGAAAGTISFHAVGLSPGTVWHFGFNGTEYSSTTPWINVTDHPGTFAVVGYPVVSENGSVGYTPTGLGSTWAVTPGTTYNVNFVSAYRVVATAGLGGSISGTGHGTLWLPAASTASFYATATSAYTFGGWTGAGSGSYSGMSPYANVTVNGPLTETAAFYPLPVNRFTMTFTENGLAAGTWWTVFLSGVGYSTNQPVLHVNGLYPCGAQGNYNLSVPNAYPNGTSLVRFAPGAHPSTVCTTGSSQFAIGFAPQFYLTLQSTGGGFAEAMVGSLTVSASTWVPNATSVVITAVSLPGFTFLGWNGSGPGSYTGTSASVSLTMTAPVTEVAAFGQPPAPAVPRYWLNLSTSTPFAPNTVWTVTVNGVGYSSAGSSINVTGLLTGTYPLAVPPAYSPDGLSRYSGLNVPSSVSVSHNTSLAVGFSTSYWVTIAATLGGTVNQPRALEGWYGAGTTSVLNATALEGYVFLGWSGTGSGAYTGDLPQASFKAGGPITEVASFAPAPPAPRLVTSTSVWSAPTTWVGFALVGVVAGIAVGLLLGRRRAPPASAAPPSESDTPTVENDGQGGTA